MNRLWARITILVVITVIFSCSDVKLDKPDDRKLLLVGQWNSYEIGSEGTGFTPGQESLLTLVYASGITFYANGNFGMRFYNNGTWKDGSINGRYGFVNNQTIELIFSPNTMDETKLELTIDKLNEDIFWFKHYHWVNDQNSDPTENHLERVK